MRALIAMLLMGVATCAASHPLAPALLELRETGADRYEVRWRTSVSRIGGVEVAPRWPQGCALAAPLSTVLSDERDAIEARGELQCAGLAGRKIEVTHLDRAGIAVVVRVQRVAGSVQQALLDAQHPAWIVPPPDSTPTVFADYLQLGVEHLVLGVDHLMFVLGLVLLVRGAARLFWTLSAFTFGHSLTLAAASLGWVEIDPRITELLIAASLLWLACEVAAGHGAGWFARWPVALAAAFGLAHGLGFAGVLAELGLPPGEIPLALFAFNMGIELGQILVVAFLLGAGVLVRRIRVSHPVPARAVAAYGMGALAAFWCFERAAMWIV